MRGPHALLFYDCQKITVRDIAVHNAGNYAVILRSCEGVMIDGISVEGGWDGVNMHDTKKATLSNCRLSTGDDCLAGRFWEDVVVNNCILNSSANAIRVGGRNVLFNNIVIRAPGKHPAGTSLRQRLECGFQILPNHLTSMRNKYATVGPVDNMVLSNITMIDVGTPVWIDYGPGAPYSKESLGVGRIIMNGLTALDAGLVPFYASAPAENPVGSIVLNNIRLSYRGGAEERLAQGQGFSPFSVLQAFGMYLRNVAHVELHDVHIDYREPEMRTPLFVENVGRLELHGFKAQRRENEFPLLQSVGKSELHIGGRAAASAVGRVTELLLPEGPVRENDYFPITTTVRNEGAAGLVPVELRLGAQRLDRAVWLEAGEKAKVSFLNVRVRQAGAFEVMAGEVKRPLQVEPRLKQVPVAAPFEFFHNTDAQAWQNPEGYYLKAAGDYSVLQFGDQYAALRRAAALSDNGTVVVKLENPDLRTSWYGRVGLMVRADITKPGKSGGYLVLGSSPANGSALEWDGDGDGRLEQHTPFDGHTAWPHWLKLVRTSRHFVGYRSRDGEHWDKIGEAEVPSATGRLDVGLFAFRSSGFFRTFEVRE